MLASLRRNDPCTCGSGKKYKKCCGSQAAVAARPVTPTAAQRAQRAPTAAQLAPVRAEFEAGRFAEAEREVRELIERFPECGFLWKVLAQALCAQDKDPLHALQQAVVLLPQEAETHNNLGNALRGRGEAAAALECHERALAINSLYAEAHNNRGSALADLGRIDEAAKSFRRAGAIKPDFVLAHVNLGNVLRALGRWSDAADSYRRALALQPWRGDVHNLLGNALRECGRLEEAVASHRRALALQPDDAEACSRLGAALSDLGQYDEAAASFRRSIEIEPDAAATYTNLGIVLTFQNRAADAEASFREALERDPELTSALVLLAALEVAKGQFAEAEALLRRALAIDPDMPEAWAVLGRWRSRASEDGTWLREAQRVVDLPLAPRRESRLRYALGKYCDNLREFEQAFAHYRRANELAGLSTLPYDRRRHAAYVDRHTDLYDRHWLVEAQRAAHQAERAVFIVGMWRSGTTLVEQILASHAAVFGAGEVPYWHGAMARYEQARLAGTADGCIAELAGGYLSLLESTAGGALRVIDKMCSNFLHLGLISAALPQARIIHMRRHPIDTCLSMYFQDLPPAHCYANDLGDLAHYYLQYLRLMEHWRQTLPAGVMLEVPYEALVEDPETWSRRMLEFIGLEWDPGCLEFHRTERTVLTSSKWQVREPLNRSSVGRWRNYERFIAPLLSLAGH